jgi:hypothetical protein
MEHERNLEHHAKTKHMTHGYRRGEEIQTKALATYSIE